MRTCARARIFQKSKVLSCLATNDRLWYAEWQKTATRKKRKVIFKGETGIFRTRKWNQYICARATRNNNRAGRERKGKWISRIMLSAVCMWCVSVTWTVWVGILWFVFIPFTMEMRWKYRMFSSIELLLLSRQIARINLIEIRFALEMMRALKKI